MTDSPYRTLDDNWKWYKDNYAFDSRTDCDHYFDWPTGTASMMISTKKHYHHRYWVFDKEDEEKAHGEV